MSTTEKEVQVFRKLEMREKSKAYLFFNKLLKNPYVLIAPAEILALCTTMYSIVFCIVISFYKWDLITNKKVFVGLKNFKYIFNNDAFRQSFGNTIIFVLVTVLGGLILQTLCGVFLNKDKPAHNFVQTIIFTPHIIATVVVASVFMYLMLPKGGVFNSILGIFGIKPSYWYMSADSALASMIFIVVWKGLGYGTLIVVSGLRAIPNYVYEAAKLDKASRLKTFFSITVPLLSPTIFYLLVTSTVSSFTTFDIISMMTQGGPSGSTNMLAYYIYEQGMQFQHYGRAMAAAVVLLILTSTISALQFMIAGKKVHYQ